MEGNAISTERAVAEALVPQLVLVADAAALLLDRRAELRAAERSHIELGGNTNANKRRCDRAVAREAEGAALLAQALTLWRESK